MACTITIRKLQPEYPKAWPSEYMDVAEANPAMFMSIIPTLHTFRPLTLYFQYTE